MALDDLWEAISTEHGEDGLEIANRVYAHAPEDGRQELLEALALSRGLIRVLLTEDRGEAIDQIDLINTVTALFYPRGEQVNMRILLGRHLSLDLPELALNKPETHELDENLKEHHTSADKMRHLAYMHVCKATKVQSIAASRLCNLPGLETLVSKLRSSVLSSPALQALFERIAKDRQTRGDPSADSSSTREVFLNNLFNGLLVKGEYKTSPHLQEKIRKLVDCDELAKWLDGFGLHTEIIPDRGDNSVVVITLSK